MQKDIIGHINCPVCTFEEMQVKKDKNGNAFAFCPDCATQVFTRNAHRDHHLRKNMRPTAVTVTVTEPIQEPVPVTVPEPIPPAPKQPGAKPAQKPTPKPAPKPAKTAWFQTLMAQGENNNG
jgi:hypothetical protein